MKITKVDVMLVDAKAKDNPLWTPVLCRVYTDEGIYGDGEAAMAYGRGARGAFGAIQDFAKVIIGLNPLDNEVIWEKLYKSTFWGQNGGPVIFSAISAIDVALWDIKAKFFNVPLYRLLGGKMRDKLKCYASQLQFGWGDERIAIYKIEDYVSCALKAIEEGYKSIKIDFFTFAPDGSRYNSEDTTRLQPAKMLKMLEERVAAVRKAVGDDIDIIVENHSYIDAQVAIQLAKVLEKYNILFFEEPCTPTPKINKFVSDKINIPIAQGERIYTRWQFAPYFEDNSIQVIQPDIGNCGGITEVKKICDMAHVYDVGVQIHVCSSPLLTAVSLHLEACIPNFTIHEHHVYNKHEYNKRLCIYDYQPVDGYFSIPEKVGIGNELSSYVFENSEKVSIE